MSKWVIIRVKTDEPIYIYNGDFTDLMNFLHKNYIDGEVDVESYESWLERQKKGK